MLKFENSGDLFLVECIRRIFNNSGSKKTTCFFNLGLTSLLKLLSDSLFFS